MPTSLNFFAIQSDDPTIFDLSTRSGARSFRPMALAAIPNAALPKSMTLAAASTGIPSKSEKRPLLMPAAPALTRSDSPTSIFGRSARRATSGAAATDGVEYFCSSAAHWSFDGVGAEPLPYFFSRSSQVAIISPYILRARHQTRSKAESWTTAGRFRLSPPAFSQEVTPRYRTLPSLLRLAHWPRSSPQ